MIFSLKGKAKAMGFIEVFLIGVGLSMDAVCVSMTNGMCYKLKLKMALCVGAVFGVFQGLMPVIGYYAASLFAKQIAAYDHWIALILLAIIGGKMLYDGIKGGEEDSCPVLNARTLLVQGVATSIDALAIGVSFAALSTVNIFGAAGIIATCTFLLSVIAVFVGKKIGNKLGNKAEIFGGTILLLIGLKIFVEHVFL